MKRNFKIMDVTLRDGSYAINFQFSKRDTCNIGRLLEDAGLEYIEIGHGVGINAGNVGKGEALCTDEEYLDAAAGTLKKASYGMFCIPGIAKVEQLAMLKEYGASFVRIGTNVEDVEASREYIEEAKRLGFLVMANYMKSYTASPDEFFKKVVLSQKYGADIIYVVDSAGGMCQEQIKQYFEIIKSIGDIKCGFHGHDNLGMAVSNSLYAVALGFDFVDTSICGMGRSAGNAATELLCAYLKKWKDINEYDVRKIIEIGEKYIKPLYGSTKHDLLNIYSGLTDFHSSYMPFIQKVSDELNVDPIELIERYTSFDKVNMNEDKLIEIGKTLDKMNSQIFFDYKNYHGKEQSDE